MPPKQQSHHLAALLAQSKCLAVQIRAADFWSQIPDLDSDTMGRSRECRRIILAALEVDNYLRFTRFDVNRQA